MSNNSVHVPVPMNIPMGVPFPTKVSLTLAYVVTFLLAIVGNSFIIHVVCRQHNMRTAFNYLIVNMAAADILDALVAMPGSVLYLFVLNRWLPGVLGTITCKFVAYAVSLSIVASVLTLTLIAIDRYLAIVHVMKRPLSVHAVKRAITFIWVLSGVLFAGELYKFNIDEFNGESFCGSAWSDNLQRALLFTQYEMVVKFVVAYAVPTSVMAVLYSLIVWCLWHRKAPGEFSNDNQRRMKRQMKKVITMLLTIVLIFNLCWIPVHVNHLLIAFDLAAYHKLPFPTTLVFYWLAHANSAINPCLYFIFNESFRDGLKKVFRRCYGRKTRFEDRASILCTTITHASAVPTQNYSSPSELRQKYNISHSSDETIPMNPVPRQQAGNEKLAMKKIKSGIRKISLNEIQSTSYCGLSPRAKHRSSDCSAALIGDTTL